MKYLFVFGSLITEKSPYKLKPLESVFVEGYKIFLEKKKDSQNNYHFIKLKETSDLKDIVSGYLVEIDEDILNNLDKYEGSAYERTEVDVVKRNLEKVKAFVYI